MRSYNRREMTEPQTVMDYIAGTSNDISQITDNIFLSGIRPLCERPESLRVLGITHILSGVDTPLVREVHRRVLQVCPWIIILTIPYRDVPEQDLHSDDPYILAADLRREEEMRGLARTLGQGDNLLSSHRFLQHAGEDAENKILVHCMAGKSRSTAMLVYHLTRLMGMSWGEALSMIQASRPLAMPNRGFLHQLSGDESMLAITHPCQLADPFDFSFP